MNKTQSKTTTEISPANSQRLQEFCLLDDIFARAYFRKHPELTEFVLRIITGIKDLVIDRSNYETQYDAKRIVGSRSLVLDVYGGDTKGRRYNLEVENWNASPERSEYHIATMCIENMPPNTEFSSLPETYVIFICGKDSIGNGRAINQFTYRNDDIGIKDAKSPHESMHGRTHIIFVNGKYDDPESDIGKLIHDFNCRKASEMFFSNLAERARYLKETDEGRNTMCAIMDKALKETAKDVSINIAKKIIELGAISHEQIAEVTGLTLEEVKKLAGQAAS